MLHRSASTDLLDILYAKEAHCLKCTGNLPLSEQTEVAPMEPREKKAVVAKAVEKVEALALYQEAAARQQQEVQGGAVAGPPSLRREDRAVKSCLRMLFDYMDGSGDGSVSRAEMVKALRRDPNKSTNNQRG